MVLYVGCARRSACRGVVSATRALPEGPIPVHPGPGEGWLHGEGQRPTPLPWGRFRPIQGGGYPLPWADFGPSSKEGRDSPTIPRSPGGSKGSLRRTRGGSADTW